MPTDPNQYRAARDHARQTMPDVLFAAQLLPRDARFAMLTAAAVVRQLYDIMAHEAECESESVEQRQGVCLSVLDHLYAGEPTGRAEMDGFAQAAQRYQWRRADFVQLIDALADMQNLRRIATWAKLRSIAARAYGPIARLAYRAAGAEPSDQRIDAWAAAMFLIDVIERVGPDWRQGRLLLPLDDLVKCKLTERDIARFVDAATAAGDARWRDLIELQSQRIANLCRGGATALTSLDPPMRRAWVMYGALRRTRFERLRSCGGADFNQPVRMNLAGRLAAVPRAIVTLRRLP
jgi:phytoene/squalene synthetase